MYDNLSMVEIKATNLMTCYSLNVIHHNTFAE